MANPLRVTEKTDVIAGPKKAFPDAIVLDDILSIQQLLPEASAQSKSLFQQGLMLMDIGDYPGARGAFCDVIRGHGGDTLKAPAYFAWGVAFYREGDLEAAADHFMNYQIFFGDEVKMQNFALAAGFDLGLTEMQLMWAATNDAARLAAAQAAARAWNSFLTRWPNSPQAPTARLSLREVQYFLSLHN